MTTAGIYFVKAYTNCQLLDITRDIVEEKNYF